MDRDKVIEMILDPGRRPAPGSPEHQAFLAYMEQSPECRAMYEQQQAVWEALDAWESPEPSEGFDRALRAKIDASAAPRSSFWSLLTRPDQWLGAAGAWGRPALVTALAVLLVVAGMILSYQSRLDSPLPSAGDLLVEQRGREPDIAREANSASDVLSPREPAEVVPINADQIEQALDDIEMLADFEALVLKSQEPGRS